MFKQATAGDCTVVETKDNTDWIKKAKTAAWRDYKGMSKRVAQERFLQLLRKVGPDWDKE